MIKKSHNPWTTALFQMEFSARAIRENMKRHNKSCCPGRKKDACCLKNQAAYHINQKSDKRNKYADCKF